MEGQFWVLESFYLNVHGLYDTGEDANKPYDSD